MVQKHLTTPPTPGGRTQGGEGFKICGTKKTPVIWMHEYGS
jgi:hypothetical protein